jgi:hypothetical protein
VATVDIAGRADFHAGMKPILLIVALAALVQPLAVIQAQTIPVLAISAGEREQATLDKHLKPIMTALNLTDAEKAAKVRAIIEAQMQAWNAWHIQHDPTVKALWREFDAARSAQNPTNADAALDKISAEYASFQPQHEKFNSDLAAVLTPAQVESVKDTLTINKVRVTYEVYLQIFPTLTDEQKAVVLKYLKAAREEAIDAGTMPEKSAFFKKYKITIEDGYLTAQGYDPKQARKDFAAKQKMAEATKKAAAAPPVADQKQQKQK